jgi:hypothetical protein
MKNSDKTKHIREIPAEVTNIHARHPFRVEKQEQRRFIRLEISSPMSLKKVKDGVGNYWPHGDWHVINGMILNISAGGVLVDLDQAVEAGDVVSMHFTLQEVECIDNVLGLVKRAEIEPEGCVAGIEFISKDILLDHFSKAEMDLLDEHHTNFDRSVRQVLNRYVSEGTAARQG